MNEVNVPSKKGVNVPTILIQLMEPLKNSVAPDHLIATLQQ